MRIIHDELGPLVVGRDAVAVEECWEAMRRITFDQLRDRRFAMQAIALCRLGHLGRHRQGAANAAVAAVGRLPGRPADDRDRRLLHRRSGQHRRRR